MEMPALTKVELATLSLRALYEKNGYQPYRVGGFENYDLYMQNKNFLQSGDIITFTGANGGLMALRPDVTLSIVKSTKAGEERRLYYAADVFRKDNKSGEYREINQMGVEYVGGEGIAAEKEVLCLAAKSLSAIGGARLDLSHMELIEAMLAVFAQPEARAAALDALAKKSPHAMRAAAQSAALDEAETERLVRFTQINGGFDEALQTARSIVAGLPRSRAPQVAQAALDELAQLAEAVKQTGFTAIGLDFSIINDAAYYNGLIFQGFVQSAPRHVLGGGRYDNLMARFGKPQGAVGFALYMDEIMRAEEQAENGGEGGGYLNIALPKGRLGEKVYAMFEKAGLSCAGVLGESRKLVFEDDENRVRYFLVKPTDVDIYVEHGVADIGVVGKDVLLENGSDVLELLDMRLGKCRLAVAAPCGFAEDTAVPLRVATKYPNVARGYFAAMSREVEIIKLHGSMELAPLIGLSDVIVDIVETGSTLKENDMEVTADIAESSARLVANCASWRFKGVTIQNLLAKIREEV